MILVQHKKFHLHFDVIEKYEAGIELAGFEVKSLRNKLGSLDGAYVILRGGEPFLVNAYIPSYQPANAPPDYDPYRPRKLLLSKKEIRELSELEKQARLTIVPKLMYNKGRYIKLEIAVARGKKKYDKREHIKKKDVQRDIERAMKDRER